MENKFVHILSVIFISAILVILAFPRYTREYPGKGQLGIKFYCFNITFSNAGPTENEFYTIYFYPAWTIGGFAYCYKGGREHNFRQGPMWWLAILEFVSFYYIFYRYFMTKEERKKPSIFIKIRRYLIP